MVARVIANIFMRVVQKRIQILLAVFFVILSLSLAPTQSEAKPIKKSATSSKDSDTNSEEKLISANPAHEQNPWMRRIALFGDSMLKTPDRLFAMGEMFETALVEKLNHMYPDDPQFGSKFSMDIRHFNAPGGRISDMFSMVNEFFGIWKVRGFRPPDIVLIYQVSHLDDIFWTLKRNESGV